MLQALYQSSEKRRETSDGIDAVIYSNRPDNGAKFDEGLTIQSDRESRRLSLALFGYYFLLSGGTDAPYPRRPRR